MSAPCRPLWTHGSTPRHRAGHPNPGLRVSDAERAEVADRLSKHYGDGRLDQAEFNERLDRAMNAKTRADLSDLFTDLPGAETAEEGQHAQHGRRILRTEGPHTRHGRGILRILVLVLVIVTAAVAGHALARSFLPWLLIGLAAFFWLRQRPRRDRQI